MPAPTDQMHTRLAPRARPPGRRFVDGAHHHPRVTRSADRWWEWSCACGARAGAARTRDWRTAWVGALVHSATISD